MIDDLFDLVAGIFGGSGGSDTSPSRADDSNRRERSWSSDNDGSESASGSRDSGTDTTGRHDESGHPEYDSSNTAADDLCLVDDDEDEDDDDTVKLIIQVRLPFGRSARVKQLVQAARGQSDQTRHYRMWWPGYGVRHRVVCHCTASQRRAISRLARRLLANYTPRLRPDLLS
ncbi:hypothetical protein JNJ66_05395 [Candidatus Saccharibacteria bacterium]|nr:hypothetical protein [Candidatus Saccharibacteria bacterium]